MGINLSGQVPGEQLNGLGDMEEDLLDERTPEPFLAIVVIERASRKYDDVKQVTSATVRFKHIEPIEDADDEKAVRGYLEKAYANRTGASTMETQLDMDEDEAPVEKRATVTDLPVSLNPMWEPDPDGDVA